MEYKIIKSTDYLSTPRQAIYELQAHVNILIKKGWQPIGGVAIDASDSGQFYYQTMLKP